MPKYRVYLQTHASTCVTVDLDTADIDPEMVREMVIEKAFEADLPSLCFQCSGWGGQPGIELSDVWEPLEGDDGVTEVSP